MKRLAILGVALCLSACETDVPGLTCKVNSDCTGGVCDRGICVEQQCPVACGAYQICLRSTCTSAFEKLAIDEPAPAAELTSPFTATVSLTRRSSALAEPPESITLLAKSDAGDQQTFALARVEGGLSYRAAVALGGLGGFTLTAESSELGLTSAPTKVTLKQSTCNPECGSDEYCFAGECRPAFPSIEIVEPSSGTVTDASIPVRVLLRRTPGSPHPYPSSVTLLPKRQGVSAQALELPLSASAPGEYTGAFSPDHGGHWSLVARYQQLESDAVAVSVTTCPQICGAFQDCVAGECLDAYSELRIVSPADAARVGKNVSVSVSLARRTGSANTASPSVTVKAVASNGAEEKAATLSAQNDGSYVGTLALPEEQTYTLTAATDAVAQASAPVTVHADFSGPAFTLEIPSPPTRLPHEVDAQSPNAWRRDETIFLTFKSDAADLVATTVRASAQGTSGAVKSLPLAACAPPPATGFCAIANLNLGDSDLSFRAFRGEFSVSISGEDDLGNLGGREGKIPVTRWKWAVDADLSTSVKQIRVAPAIGESGLIYLGTTSGKAVAIRPDGSIAWSFATGGPIEASIAVARVNNHETAFVAGTKSGVGGIWGLSEGSHAADLAPICSDGTEALGSVAVSSVALGTETAASATAFIAFRQAAGATIKAARPDATKKCHETGSDSAISGSSGFAIRNGTSVYFGDEDGRIQSIDLTASGLVSRWTQLVGVGNQPTNPILVTSGISGGLGVGLGGLFRVPFAGATTTVAAMDSSTWNAIAVLDGSTERIVAGSTKGGVYIVDEAFEPTVPPTVVPASWTLSGALKGAPAFGSDKALYFASTDKRLFVRDLSGSAIWEAELGAGSISSPALDCSRDLATGDKVPGRPGVVYLGADDGKLYAFITDSRGIDTASPWPKFHRDPRNSADSSVTLSDFSCE